MSVNIKLGNNILTGVNVLKVQDADTTGTYDNFIEPSDATATSSDIANGKTAYTSNGKVTGSALVTTITINQDNTIDLIIA